MRKGEDVKVVRSFRPNVDRQFRQGYFGAKGEGHALLIRWEREGARPVKERSTQKVRKKFDASLKTVKVTVKELLNKW